MDFHFFAITTVAVYRIFAHDDWNLNDGQVEMSDAYLFYYGKLPPGQKTDQEFDYSHNYGFCDCLFCLDCANTARRGVAISGTSGRGNPRHVHIGESKQHEKGMGGIYRTPYLWIWNNRLAFLDAQYLKTLVETGMLGFAAFGFMIYTILKETGNGYRRFCTA